MKANECKKVRYWLQTAILGIAIMISACTKQGVTLERVAQIGDSSWQASGPVSLENNYAYVPVGTNGVRVISIADPNHPIDLGLLDIPELTQIGWYLNSFKTVTVEQNMYVAGTNNFLIYDVASNPQHPQISGTWSEFEVWDIAVANNTVYVVSRSALHSVDVTSLQEPKSLGWVFVGGLDYNAIATSGDIVFVTARSKLLLIDATNPREMSQISEIELPLLGLEDASSLAVSSNYVYVLSDSLLFIIDSSDPRNPQLVNTFEIPRATPAYFPSSSYGYPSPQITITNNYAFVGSGSELIMIDISNPQDPAKVGSFTLPDIIRGITVSADMVYLTSYKGGLNVLRFK